MRLALLLGLFIALTGLGVWWASPDRVELVRAWGHFASLPVAIHLGIAGLALGLLGAEMLRLVVMGRALGAKVGFWAALDATIANNFFSWITPGSALGEPAAAFMLGRRGVPWDAAVLIAFGKFVISFALIFGIAFVLVAAGLGPPIPSWVLVPIAWALGFFALLLLFLVVGSFWPERAIGIVAALERMLGARRLFRGKRARRALGAVGATAPAWVRAARPISPGWPGALVGHFGNPGALSRGVHRGFVASRGGIRGPLAGRYGAGCHRVPGISLFGPNTGIIGAW